MGLDAGGGAGCGADVDEGGVVAFDPLFDLCVCEVLEGGRERLGVEENSPFRRRRRVG